MSLADLDPTGTLSAASAAIGLVGAVLRVAPAIKNLKGPAVGTNTRTVSGPTAGSLHRAESTPLGVHSLTPDPECERRAYETVNFVLREIGSRLCAAGLVDEHALTKALTAAAQHIEVKLFSAEANRLFESLAPKLADPILVNSVFTSIYLIGALTAELSSSLPNYKDTYAPLGPRLVQQVFRAAIGEDAFRDNLTANLDAYKTLATTAGLLRPTDIGYLTFPHLPSFAPCKYSSKSFTDVRHNKGAFEKLVKHFDRAGFPQPTPARQAEVGLIRDWRFLSSDANSRVFDVEKADKNIGENFGKVLHWLLCSAERIPPGQAVIAYYDQHVQLVKWIGYRMGYTLLFPTVDLNMSGPHATLDGRTRHVFESWILIMSSEPARASKKAMSERWMQSRMQSTAKAGAPLIAQAQRLSQPTHHPISPHRTMSQSTVPPSHAVTTANGPQAGIPPPATAAAPELASNAPSMQSTESRLEQIERHLKFSLLPSCQNLISHPPAGPNAREAENTRMIRVLEKEILEPLNAMQIVNNESARHRRKEMLLQLQNLIDTLTVAKQSDSSSIAPVTAKPVPHISQAVTSLPEGGGGSPPPYSPASTSALSSDMPSGQGPASLPAKRTSTVIRRKAPPPPKKFILAKALYTFEPDPDNEEELGFNEGDEVEIIEKTAALEEEGWCRARVNGQKKIGLMPLDYLEIVSQLSLIDNKPAKPLTATLPSVGENGSPENPLVQSVSPVYPEGHSWTRPLEIPPSIVSLSATHDAVPPITSSPSHPSQIAPTSPQSHAPFASAHVQINPQPQSHEPLAVAHQPPAWVHNGDPSPGLVNSCSEQHVSLANGPQYPSQNQSYLMDAQHQSPVHVGSQQNGPAIQSNVVSHRSRKLEAAGLGIAAVGAASAFMPANGTASNQQVIENQTVINTNDQQDNPDGVNVNSSHSAEVHGDQSRTTECDFQDEATHPHTNTSASGGPDIIYTNNSVDPNGSVSNHTVTANEALEITPVADLSAFSEPPFNPPSTTAPSSLVPFPTEPSPMPEGSVSAVSTDLTAYSHDEFEYTNTTIVETVDAPGPPLSSPFASLVTPSAGPPDTYTGDEEVLAYESTTLVEESSSIATPMTQPSADATISNATCTEWEADGVSQDVTYDLEF